MGEVYTESLSSELLTAWGSVYRESELGVTHRMGEVYTESLS